MDDDIDLREGLRNGFRLYRQLNKSRGWRARFCVLGIVHSKYFSDAEYGSTIAARQAAELFASQNQTLHKELAALRSRFDVRANCRSGLPGVARYNGHISRGPFWLAFWDDQNGRRITRRFSVKRLGEAKAFQMALKSREDGVRSFRERYDQILQSFELETGLAKYGVMGQIE